MALRGGHEGGRENFFFHVYVFLVPKDMYYVPVISMIYYRFLLDIYSGTSQSLMDIHEFNPPFWPKIGKTFQKGGGGSVLPPLLPLPPDMSSPCWCIYQIHWFENMNMKWFFLPNLHESSLYSWNLEFFAQNTLNMMEICVKYASKGHPQWSASNTPCISSRHRRSIQFETSGYLLGL